MRRSFRVSAFVTSGLLVVAAVAVPLAVGVRPVIGARARALTDRHFGATSARVQTDDDLRAVFAYLQTLTAVAHRVDNALPATRCLLRGAVLGAGDQNVQGTRR